MGRALQDVLAITNVSKGRGELGRAPPGPYAGKSAEVKGTPRENLAIPQFLLGAEAKGTHHTVGNGAKLIWESEVTGDKSTAL